MRYLIMLCVFTLIFTVYSDNKIEIIDSIKGSSEEVVEWDNYSKYIVPIDMSEDKNSFKKYEEIYGSVKRTFYHIDNLTTKEVYNFHLNLFKEKGFKIWLDGNKEDIGSDFFDIFYKYNPWRYNKNYAYTAPFASGNSDTSYFISASKNNIYVTFFTISGWTKYPDYRIDIIDTNANVDNIIKSEQKYNSVGIVENSEFSKEEISKFSLYNLVLNPEIEKKRFKNVRNTEGKVYKYLYFNEKSSSFGIYKSYLNHLNNKGYEILCQFEGKDLHKDFNEFLYEENPWDNDRNYGDSYPLLNGNSNSAHYILGKKSEHEKDIYVSIFSFSGSGYSSVYRIDIVHTDAEIPDIISVDAIDRSILEKGKVELYGILFKTGSYNIMDASENTLKILADYINNSKKSFYLVGHTDNKGDFSMNITLSENRAKAVRDYLIKKHNVNKENIHCYGVGPLFPVSTNSTVEGRKYNRRVELVIK